MVNGVLNEDAIDYLINPVHPAVGKSDEHSSPDRRAQVQDSFGETPPCSLIAPGAYKIRRGCNVLQVPIKIIPLGVTKWGSHPLRGRSKFDGMSPDHPQE